MSHSPSNVTIATMEPQNTSPAALPVDDTDGKAKLDQVEPPLHTLAHFLLLSITAP